MSDRGGGAATSLGERVLGRRRIGRVQRGAEDVTVSPGKTDPALIQPGLPLLLGQALRLGVGERERLQLFPSERLDLRLRLGIRGSAGGSSACPGRPSPSRSSSSIAATRERTSGTGTSTRFRLPQSERSNSTQAGFDADVAASSSVR